MPEFLSDFETCLGKRGEEFKRCLADALAQALEDIAGWLREDPDIDTAKGELKELLEDFKKVLSEAG